MSYRLVITEKPSVAQAYAKVLGATNRNDGYLEGGGYLVSWCVGHLVELAPPNIYDEKHVKWSVADLPILPEKWQYLVSTSTKKQFSILKKLMHREDVESLICATDAGREGELIFRLVYQQAGCKKPFSRLWLSSMEDSAIRKGFANLKPSTEYDALYNAALCRECADWMVGINATRLFSCLYGAAHGTKCFTSGAVATAGDTIVLSYIDEFQFAGSDAGVIGVPNSDSDFGAGYAEGKVLMSKRVNADYYSKMMAEKAGSTVSLDANYDAIQNHVNGMSIADAEALSKDEKAVDAVSGATLVDTAGYVGVLVDAAK